MRGTKTNSEAKEGGGQAQRDRNRRGEAMM